MWFARHCLTLHAACQPATAGQLAEWVTGAAIAFTALLGAFCALLGALEWLDSWL